MDDDPVCELHDEGRPSTAQAVTWVMLQPGWIVRDVQSGNAIEVRYEGARIYSWWPFPGEVHPATGLVPMCRGSTKK